MWQAHKSLISVFSLFLTVTAKSLSGGGTGHWICPQPFLRIP